MTAMTNPSSPTAPVTWVIDPEVFLRYQDELVAEIERQGHKAVFLPHVKYGYSWDDEGCSYRRLFANDRPVIFHGCIEMTRRIADENIGVPGIYATLDAYYCTRYYCALGEYLLNQRYVMLPFGELDRCRDFLFSVVGRDGKFFIRPDSPCKPFAGQLVSNETFDKDMELVGFYDVPPHELVVVSEPQSIETEWRFVIAAEKVVAGSRYQVRGEPSLDARCDREAEALASRIAASSFQPDPIWVADVCRTTDGRLALLEIGCFSHSDLYACDKAAVVDAVSSQAIRDFEKRGQRPASAGI